MQRRGRSGVGPGRRGGPRSRLGRVLLAITVGALAAAGLAALAVPAAAIGPTVTVTPDRGLAGGETVSVSGSGFSPNVAQLIVVQCAASASGNNACDVANVQFTRTDATGSFTVSLRVASQFAATDCAKVQCIVQAHEGINPSTGRTGTSAPLVFGGARLTTPAPASTAPTVLPSLPATPDETTPPARSSTPKSPSTHPSSAHPSSGVLAVLPTAADSGQATASAIPLVSKVCATLAALAIALSVGLAYRRRLRHGH